MHAQDLISHTISKLPQNASMETITGQLDPFIRKASVHNDFGKNDAPVDITPLMMACDRAQVACLQYMRNHPCSRLWGAVDSHSSLQNGANTALHHAAVAGCVEAIELLDGMEGSTMIKSLVQLKNEHGDTPIMMACAFNQIDFLLKLKTMFGEAVFLQSLNAENDSGDSSLSLAFIAGHVNVVKLLLSCGLDVPYDVVQMFREKLQQCIFLWRKAGIHQTQDVVSREIKIKQCLDLLESELEVRAQKSMEQLLQIENERTSLKEKKVTMKPTANPRIRKQRKDPLKQAAESSATKSETTAVGWTKDAKKSPHAEKVTQANIRTLLDGSVVCQGSDDSQSLHVTLDDCKTIQGTKLKSLDELLRDCLRDPKYRENSIDVAMDALCLDASMLLLSPHGMALNLSPSQLETVDIILHQQIESVRQAKQIQAKLLKSGSALERPE